MCIRQCTSCRSRKMLKNECLLAKIGVDTAENRPKVDEWRNELLVSLILGRDTVCSGAFVTSPSISARACMRGARSPAFSAPSIFAPGFSSQGMLGTIGKVNEVQTLQRMGRQISSSRHTLHYSDVCMLNLYRDLALGNTVKYSSSSFIVPFSLCS